jgi:hypothetical protein
MTEQFTITEAGALAMKIADLETVLRHFDRASMDLHLYIRSIDGMPNTVQWRNVVDQVAEMVDAHGPRNPYR